MLAVKCCIPTKEARIGSVILAMAVLEATSVSPATMPDISKTTLHVGKSFNTTNCSPRYLDNPDTWCWHNLKVSHLNWKAFNCSSFQRLAQVSDMYHQCFIKTFTVTNRVSTLCQNQHLWNDFNWTYITTLYVKMLWLSIFSWPRNEEFYKTILKHIFSSMATINNLAVRSISTFLWKIYQ